MVSLSVPFLLDLRTSISFYRYEFAHKCLIPSAMMSKKQINKIPTAWFRVHRSFYGIIKLRYRKSATKIVDSAALELRLWCFDVGWHVRPDSPRHIALHYLLLTPNSLFGNCVFQFNTPVQRRVRASLDGANRKRDISQTLNKGAEYMKLKEKCHKQIRNRHKTETEWKS